MKVQMSKLCLASLVLLTGCGDDNEKKYITAETVREGAAVAKLAGAIFSDDKPIPILEAGSYTNGMSRELKEELASLREYIGDKTELTFSDTFFGNRFFVYYMKDETPRFYWLYEPELTSPVKLPDEVVNQLKTGGLSLQRIESEIGEIVGNNNFVAVLGKNGSRELVSFHNYATLEELSRFTRRLYSEIISKELSQANEFPIEHIPLLDLCIEASAARLRTVCFQFVTGLCFGRTEAGAGASVATAALMMAGAVFEDDTAKKIGKINDEWVGYMKDMNLRRDIFQACLPDKHPLACDQLFGWSDSSKKIIEKLTANQLIRSKDIDNCPSLEYGRLFSKSKRKHLLFVVKHILENGTTDIRQSGCDEAVVELDNCERACSWWKAINGKEYLISAAELMRINREILIAAKAKTFNPGFEELTLHAEEWRTILRTQMRRYHILFSDLPVVLSCQKAFSVTQEADGFWSKDRSLIRRTAQNWVRFCADGGTCQYLRSNFAADIMTQYHGYLKKVLGPDDYKRLETTLKVSFRREDAEFPSHL